MKTKLFQDFDIGNLGSISLEFQGDLPFALLEL